MKLRVWHIPQVGMSDTIYIPVSTAKEGKKIMDLLGAYDCFLENNHIREDYCNANGLEMYDEEAGEWVDWFLETEDNFYEDVDVFLENDEESQEFAKEVLSQVHFY